MKRKDQQGIIEYVALLLLIVAALLIVYWLGTSRIEYRRQQEIEKLGEMEQPYGCHVVNYLSSLPVW
jgi:flagellar basal body-associated protein FliL